MESKKINQLATELSPALSDLTIIGDPTTGISKKITLSQMASLFTGTVEEYANVASFPLVGAADTIYIALDTNVLYRWDTGLTSYVELSPNIINSLVFNDANGFDGTISLVGSVATLTITTALTTGSVGFIGASGALTQDNSNFYWDNTNKRLGIATNAPTTAIDTFGSGIITRVNGTSTNNAFIGFASAGTNKWSVGNVQSDHRFRIYSEANTSELVSVLQTGEFGIGIANPTTKLHIDGGASALIANLDANVSVAKSVSFRSDNSNRFNIEVSGTESGSNAGADFFIRRYSDAGALLNTPITITRSTGAISLSANSIGFGVGSPTAIDGTNGTLIIPKIRLYNVTPASVYHDIVSGASTNKSITIPDITGTMALLEGTQTFSGAKTFSSTLNAASARFTGDVELNGASGTRTLTIQNNTSGNAVLALVAAGSNNADITYNRSTSELTFTNSGALNAFKLAANGNVTFSSNVGIGISPSYKLDVSSGASGIVLSLDSLNAYNAETGISMATNRAKISAFLESGSGTPGSILRFYTMPNGGSVTERLVITSSGNVGIGTTDPSSFRLSVSGAGNAVAISSSNNSLCLALGYQGTMHGYLGGISSRLEAYSNNGGYVYLSSSSTWIAASDKNRKRNFETYSLGLNEILGLKPSLYNMDFQKDGDEKQLGLIAQEVKEYIPKAFEQSEDFIGLNYNAIVVTMVNAIKELKTELDELKSK